jgi:hypothetical protein
MNSTWMIIIILWSAAPIDDTATAAAAAVASMIHIPVPVQVLLMCW